MANEALAFLARFSVIASLGILLVIPLRGLARRAVGTEAAYWLWLIVPGSLIAVFLPQAPVEVCRPDAFLSPLLIRGIGAPLNLAPSLAVNACSLTVTLTWCTGAAVALGCFVGAQWLLRRSLGPLQVRPDGTHCSSMATHPMVVGAWNARIVLPGDFETRYSLAERSLILSHERTHLQRKDALTNAIASGLVCLFWFNPLVYWAWSRFRFDQEIACDAAVIRQTKVSRRRYAQALARTHLTASRAVAFGWRDRHPLIQRIALLGCPTPSHGRRLVGYALAVVLMFSGAYVVWVASSGAKVL